MDYLLKLLKVARYVVFILTLGVSPLVFYIVYTSATLTYYKVVGVALLLLFPVLFLHTLYATLRARQQKILTPFEVTPLTTFGLPDRVFVYGYLVLALLFTLIYVSVIDQLALDAAQERVEREVPNLEDSNIEAGPSDNLITAGSALVIREQILAGTITIAMILPVPSSELDQDIKPSVITFVKGTAQTCTTDLKLNSTNACDTFRPGQFVIKDASDFIASTSPQLYLGTQYVNGSGVVLVEHDHDGVIDTLTYFLTDYPGHETLDSDLVFTLPGITGAHIISFKNLVLTAAVRYDELIVATSKREEYRYIYETDYVRNGPNLAWYETKDGSIVKEQPVRLYDQSGENRLGTHWYHFRPSPSHLQVNSFNNLAFYDESRGFKERVYYKDACEVPYTYSDLVYRVTDGDSYLGNLSVSFPNTDVYKLTTGRYGYEPSEWGTVLEQRSVTSEQQAIISGVPFKGLETKVLTIAGIPVRQTLPFLLSRPCQDSGYRQIYQWVQAGNLYSLETSSAKTKEEHLALQLRTEAIIAQLMTGFTYVPAEVSN